MSSEKEKYRADNAHRKRGLITGEETDRRKKRAVTASQESDSDDDFKTPPPQPEDRRKKTPKKVIIEKKATQTQLYMPKKVQKNKSSPNVFGQSTSSGNYYSSSNYNDRHGDYEHRSTSDFRPKLSLSKSTSSYKSEDRYDDSKTRHSSNLLDELDTTTIDDILERDKKYRSEQKLYLPKKSKPNDSDSQQDKQPSKLFLPSKKKKEDTADNNSDDDDSVKLEDLERAKMIEKKLEETHRIEKAIVFTCPFCLAGFDKTTKVIEKELDLMAEEDRAYKKKYKKEHENSSFKKPDGLIKRVVPTKEKESFCRLHERELVIKPEGRAKGYIFDIDFKALRERIKLMEMELDDVIYKRIPSDYRNVILEDYGNMGTNKARTPMMMMNRMDLLMPGYYGPRGAAVMLDVLSEMYLESGKLSKQLSAPQMPMEYLHQVLIPETSYRLIRQDLFRKQRRENPGVMMQNVNDMAKAIMRESRHFGEAMHPLTDDKEEEETVRASREAPKKQHHVTIVLDDD